MFDRTERQFFQGQDVHAVVGTIQRTLHESGVISEQTSASTWAGRGGNPSWGLVPKTSIVAAPTPGGFAIDFRVTADVEATGIIVFFVLWMFCFPAALLAAWMAYQDFTKRQTEMFEAVWRPLHHLFVAPNYPPVFGNAQPPPGPPPAG